MMKKLCLPLLSASLLLAPSALAQGTHSVTTPSYDQAYQQAVALQLATSRQDWTSALADLEVLKTELSRMSGFSPLRPFVAGLELELRARDAVRAGDAAFDLVNAFARQVRIASLGGGGGAANVPLPAGPSSGWQNLARPSQTSVDRNPASGTLSQPATGQTGAAPGYQGGGGGGNLTAPGGAPSTSSGNYNGDDGRDRRNPQGWGRQ